MENDNINIENGPSYNKDYNELTDVMQIGDVFAVIAEEGNEEEVDYYLLLCTKTKHSLEASIMDDYGIDYSRGDMVVEGKYYVLGKTRSTKFLLYEQYQWKKKYVQYSHLVIGTRLHLKPHNKSKKRMNFELTIEDHETLLDAIREREEA